MTWMCMHCGFEVDDVDPEDVDAMAPVCSECIGAWVEDGYAAIYEENAA